MDLISKIAKALEDLRPPRRKIYYDYEEGTIVAYTMQLHDSVIKRIDIHTLKGGPKNGQGSRVAGKNRQVDP